MKITKTLAAAAAASAILVLMAACGNEPDNSPNEDIDGPTHFDGALIISMQQVWEQNKEAKQQSDEWYYKFEGSGAIDVFAVFSCDAEEHIIPAPQSAGSGKIDKGILSFEVGALDAENLVDAHILFPSAIFKEYTGVMVNPPETMGNIILPVTATGERLNREGLLLMHSSVGLESIQFVYVDRDCQITGSPDTITWNLGPQSYISHTESAIDLSLKKGWNTVFRMEVFDSSSGYDNVSTGIKNPNNFKWVIYTRQ